MIATHLGFYNTATTRTHVRFQFSTHNSAGANVAPSSAFEAADLRIYKAADGAAFSATQRSSANGIIMTSPFDSLTGYHDVDIDLTDNTDAGFYVAGALYAVVLAPDETIDSQTITGMVLAYFEIGRPQADVREFGGSVGTFASGRPEVNTTHFGGSALTQSSGRPEVNTTHVGGTSQTAGDIIDDTNDIQARLPAALVGGRIDANVGAISTDATAADNAEAFFDGTGYAGTGNTIPTVTNLTNAPTAGDLTATMKASVNTEVLDVLTVDTFAEPGQENPPATTTLGKKIGYVYKFLRNKITQTATEQKVFADDGTTVDQKSTVSDDGTTYTRGEFGTGP